ncbi:MAG: hypothetical protein WEB13_04860 [Dehalococcoidia bacterium]
MSVLDDNMRSDAFRSDLEAVLRLTDRETLEWADLAVKYGSIEAIHRLSGEDSTTFAHVASFLVQHAARDTIASMKQTVRRAIEAGQITADLSASDLPWLDVLAANDRIVGSALAEHALLNSGRSLYDDHSWFVDARAITDETNKFYGFAPLLSFTLMSDKNERLSVDMVEGEVRALRDSLEGALAGC